jgi:hypothetical protein
MFRSKYVRIGIFVFVALLASSCSWFKGKGESEPQTVGPDGGTFTFDNGITIVVPSGALSEETSLQVNQVENTSVSSILEQSVMSMRPLVFFEALPDGMQLDEPVEVVVPLPDDVEVEGWPVHLVLDMENETFTYASTGLQYDPENREITFILDHFSPHGAGEVPDGEEPNECENPATACRCGWIHVEYEFRDYESEDCEGVSEDISVQFMDCPGQPTERVQDSELSEGCTWQGTLGLNVLMMMEGQEIHMNCSDPVPFKVEEGGDITGGGTMQCVINDSIEIIDPEAGSITATFDSVFDLTQSLSGKLDGFELKFDAPRTESIDGYFKVEAEIPEMGNVLIMDIEFGGDTVSGEMGLLEGFPLLTISTSIDSDDSEMLPAMNFKLLDGETFEHIYTDEGANAIFTVTLNLTVGKE